MSERKTTEILSDIVELLTPLESEERLRIIQASMTLLGETTLSRTSSRSVTGESDDLDEPSDTSALTPRVRAWLKQNTLSMAVLEQLFHFEDGKVEVIAAEIPGSNKREKTYNAYLLTGIAQFLATGNPTFDDKTARALCEISGCYDQANHANTIKHRGNEFTGSKEKGWTVTAPGLKRAAALIKEMTQG